MQTYLERDVRAVTAVRDPATFRRFLGLLAGRHGQLLNKTDLAAPLGVSIPTIAQGIRILEITGQVIVVPPFFENLGKRLVKSPKVYFAGSGLACHLLGIHTRRELEGSPFRGSIFEGFIASEIVKAQQNAGRRREIFHFRDQQGLEVDFLVPGPKGPLLAACKASASVSPADAAPMRRLLDAIHGRHGGLGRGRPECIVIHQGRKFDAARGIVAPDLRAERWQDFTVRLAALAGSRR